MCAACNVLHVVSTNRLSGAERIVQLICRYLNQDLFKPVIVCAGDPLGKTYEDDGHLVELCPVALPTPISYLRMRKIIRKRDIRLIHAHDHRASLLAWLSTRVGLRVPLVSHIHCANPWLQGIHPFKVAELFLRRRYDISIACSEAIRDYYVKHNTLVDPERILVLTNSIEVKPCVLADRGPLLEELGIPAGNFVFGTVGRLDEQKGIDYLLPAFKEVAGKINKVTLLIVGTGPQQEALQGLSDQLGLAERVVFTGYRSDVEDLFGLMDAFVLPSRWEGLPMVLMEAMNHSLPIVSTIVGGVPELIRHGETGLLVRPGDINGLAASMLYLWENKDIAAGLGTAGLNLVREKHDITKQVEKMENIYKKLLAIQAS